MEKDNVLKFPEKPVPALYDQSIESSNQPTKSEIIRSYGRTGLWTEISGLVAFADKSVLDSNLPTSTKALVLAQMAVPTIISFGEAISNIKKANNLTKTIFTNHENRT